MSRFRQVDYRQFEYGGRESRQLTTNRLKKPVEPITQLDIDVKNGLKDDRYTYNSFVKDLKDAEPPAPKIDLEFSLMTRGGDVLATTLDREQAMELQMELRSKLGVPVAVVSSKTPELYLW